MTARTDDRAKAIRRLSSQGTTGDLESRVERA